MPRSKDHWTGQLLADNIQMTGDTLTLTIIVDHDPQRPMTVELSKEDYRKLVFSVSKDFINEVDEFCQRMRDRIDLLKKVQSEATEEVIGT